MLFDYSDYRYYLSDILNKRCKKNVYYSLRAFARDLELHPARLSDILNHKKNISIDAASKISQKLNHNQYESEYFSDLVLLENTKNVDARLVIQKRIDKKKRRNALEMSSDTIKVLTDWKKFAILGLLQLTEVPNGTSWMSERLGFPLEVIEESLEILLRVGLIQRTADSYSLTQQHFKTTSDIPSSVIRSLTKQLLMQAESAIDQQSISQRDFSNIIFAVNPNKLDEAKRIIENCRRELTNTLEEGYRSEVYCFSAQLFKLSVHKPIIEEIHEE